MDRDTQTVSDRLGQALAMSGLSLRQFARALGTSPSRLSQYRSGKTAPSAAFLVRAERIGAALSRSRRDRIPTAIDAFEAVSRAEAKGDADWTFAVALEVRDRLRDILAHHQDAVEAWDAQPARLGAQWWALTVALVRFEFTRAGLEPPPWTNTPPLPIAWVLDTPRLSEDQIREQTPVWLAEANIFVAAKDLVTA